MKGTLYLSILLCLMSCSNKCQSLYGEWEVKSSYYKAIYNINNENDSIKARVVYYNDGTSVYGKSNSEVYYLFKNLKEKNDRYVDVISGETKLKKTENNVSIQLISKDSIEAITYIMNKPLKEIWVRKRDKN